MARLESDSDFLKDGYKPPASQSFRKLVKNVIPRLHQDLPKTTLGLGAGLCISNKFLVILILELENQWAY